MGYISQSDLSNYVAPSGKPGNPLMQLGKQARQAACQLWQQYPKQFVGNNPVSSPIRQAWNALCQEPPTNQPPTLPTPPIISGGQCAFRYNLYVRFNRVDLIGSPPNQSCVTSPDPQAQYPLNPYGGRGDFWGPIGGLKLSNFDSTNCGGNLNLDVLCHGRGNQARLATQQWITNQLLPGGSGSSGRLTGIAAALVVPYTSGNTDNCGNLPSDYPNNPPPTSPVNYTFNINGGDSTTNINFTYEPTFNLPISFKGPDVDITVDFGGINFDWHGNKDKPGGEKNPFPTLPPSSRPPGGRGGGGGGSNPQPDDDDVTENPPVDVPPDEVVEEEESSEKEILWVEVEVLDIPSNSKFLIESIDPENNVYFAGYLSWRTVGQSGTGDSSAEMPIRRRRTIMRKPEQYTGYRVRSTNGATLRVTSYTQVKTIPT